MKKKIRVLHLPSATGNNAYWLSRFEKNFLAKSNVLLLLNRKSSQDNINNYKADIYIYCNGLIDGVIKILFFYIINLSKYDVFHFNSGRSMITSKHGFLDMLDINLLSVFNKKIVFTYQGGTGRLKSTFINYHPEISHSEVNLLTHGEDTDKIKRRRIEKVRRYSSLIYVTNPDLVMSFEGQARFRPYTKLELKQDNIIRKINRPLRIAHAPSTPYRKGTEFITRVLNELKGEGFLFKFTLLNGLRNEQVLEMLYSYDLMIDQLIVGWYGGLALECWNVGLPVMCYISSLSKSIIPTEMLEDLPLIETSFDNLKADLINIILFPDVLEDFSTKSVSYLRKHHNNDDIAKSIINDYKNLFGA